VCVWCVGVYVCVSVAAAWAGLYVFVFCRICCVGVVCGCVRVCVHVVADF